MISSIISRIVILVFGTLYPAYASYKAVRTKNVKEYVKWMMYWIVFALFTCAETVTDVFFSWFPFYYEVKIILVLWLLSPATKGSSILYRKFVHPALCRREQEIDEYISKAKDQGYHTVLNLGTKGVNYATNVIMQTAIKGGGGLVQQLRKSYSLSDLTVADDHTDGRSQQEEDEAGDIVMDSRLLRRTVSTRGRSPRSVGGSRVDMFFPEVDTNLSHGGRRDNINLGHIRSSEDISSAYIPENMSSQDPLTRTASVGGTTRTRSKVTRSTFTSIKRPGAAEDGEVIIEEMDDEQIPTFLLQNSSNISSQSAPNDSAICLPYSTDMFENYLRFMMKESAQVKHIGDEFELDLDYKKYLELKKVFDSKFTKNIQADTEEIEKNATTKEEDSLKGKETQSLDLTSKGKPVVIPQTLNDNKTESIDSSKAPVIKVTSSEGATVETNEAKDEKIHTEDSSAPPGPFLIKESDEMKSVSASSSTFSSDSESVDEGDFTTPNSSPVFKSKLNKGGKYNKRHAPLPPSVNNISSSGQSDKNESLENSHTQSVDVESTQIQVSPINATSDFKSDIVNESGLSSLGKSNVKIPHSGVKRRHKQKNRSGRKSGVKNESAINKLINLPSKFAFWKTDDGKSSVSGDNSYSEDEESNGSTSNYENTSLSNFGSLVNIKVSSENLAEKKCVSDVESDIKLDIKNSSNQKELENEDDIFQDAKEIVSDSESPVKAEEKPKEEIDSAKILNLLTSKESNTRISSERLVGNSPDYTYIPLRVDSLVMHTESRSTDV